MGVTPYQHREMLDSDTNFAGILDDMPISCSLQAIDHRSPDAWLSTNWSGAMRVIGEQQW